ncbi:sulfatase-like hydrolase/transferase [Membranicola marinus]|uniref:Sulfatase-like hydrolase/transferase n=1 Tax=Membranihabitans marinus TaxID=1227546 RepID=A0A953HXL4_9BACT|nr:sulfatase-like hydrolase/transferase [Membranihabitans marinus]MBY5959658.1 sulfatase-like hydrolase/transferase [Membranihabitans marinus]
MPHRTYILNILTLLMMVSLSCSDAIKDKEPAEKELPNIVLLMSDDHGWDEVGYNGHPFVKTPVLDEMAATGLRFDRFYSGHSNCSPTRGSFLTGRHPNRYGTFTPGWSIRPEEITVADVLKEAGYKSAHFGKWHLGPVKKESPTNPGAMGFDEWLSHDNFFEMDPVLSRNGGRPQKIKGEGSEVIIDEAIKFIERTTQEGGPFMVVVWFGSPHEPYSALPQDLALYDLLPDSLAEKEVGLTSNTTGEKVTRPLRAVLRERYAEITAMDRSIGKLRTYLEESGNKKNTIVWFCGDNGTPKSAARTGMTLRGQKGGLYEGGVRVPGILEWPSRIKQPISTSAVSVTTDILPTLAGVTGQSLPQRPIDGIDLAPIFDDPTQKRDKPLFFWMFESRKIFHDASEPYIDPRLQEGTTPLAKKMAGKYTRNFRNFKYNEISPRDFAGMRSVMKDDYKLVIDEKYQSDEIVELYHIQNDPGEVKNLADHYPDVVHDMRTELRNWQKSVLHSLTEKDY